MKKIYYFLIGLAIFPIPSFGQKQPKKTKDSSSIVAQADTNNRTQASIIGNKVPELEKRIDSLRGFVRLLDEKLKKAEKDSERQSRDNDNANRLLELEKTEKTRLSNKVLKLEERSIQYRKDSLQLTNLIESRKTWDSQLRKSKDSVATLNQRYSKLVTERTSDLSRQTSIQKKYTEQREKDSVRLSSLENYNKKLQADLQSTEGNRIKVDQRVKELEKLQNSQQTSINTLTSNAASLENDKQNLNRELTTLRKDLEDKVIENKRLSDENKNLSQKLFGRLERNIQDAIRSLDFDRPNAFQQNVAVFAALQEECNSLGKEIRDVGPLGQQCSKVDKYVPLLKKLNDAHQALGEPYNASQGENIISDLNSQKNNSWDGKLKDNIDDHIDYLTDYCARTKYVAEQVKKARIAFEAKDKEKAKSVLTTVSTEFSNSPYTYLKNAVKNRQDSINKNIIPNDMPTCK